MPEGTSQSSASSPIVELDERSRQVFREIVDAYVETGSPTGSRTLSQRLDGRPSAATIRNVMAGLEGMGLLYAPHTSAGRLPTDAGMRLFVDGLLEIGGIGTEEQAAIDAQCAAAGRNPAETLEEATAALSGLAQCAGVVFAPKNDQALKHIEFVNLGDGQALVVLVSQDGLVENRLIDIPLGTPPAALMMASNYLNARLAGRTMNQARDNILREISEHRAELDEVSSRLVAAGLAQPTAAGGGGALIVKGQAHLLENVSAIEDLERVRTLFGALETKELMAKVLELSGDAEGVRIFIGAENEMFDMTGCSMVVAPYSAASGTLIGAIGVIGPTSINYARIIPLVDYTAKMVGRLIS